MPKPRNLRQSSVTAPKEISIDRGKIERVLKAEKGLIRSRTVRRIKGLGAGLTEAVWDAFKAARKREV